MQALLQHALVHLTQRDNHAGVAGIDDDEAAGRNGDDGDDYHGGDGQCDHMLTIDRFCVVHDNTSCMGNWFFYYSMILRE